MRTLEEHRKALESAMNGAGFLKLDRGTYLFVTDAPRRSGSVPALPDGYDTSLKDGLMYVKPAEPDVPEYFRDLYVECLKAERETRERCLRQALAAAMRSKDAHSCVFLRELAEKLKIRL